MIWTEVCYPLVGKTRKQALNWRQWKEQRVLLLQEA